MNACVVERTQMYCGQERAEPKSEAVNLQIDLSYGHEL